MDWTTCENCLCWRATPDDVPLPGACMLLPEYTHPGPLWGCWSGKEKPAPVVPPAVCSGCGKNVARNAGGMVSGDPSGLITRYWCAQCVACSDGNPDGVERKEAP